MNIFLNAVDFECHLPKTFFCKAGDIRPLDPSPSRNVVSRCKAICASSDPFDNDCENITLKAKKIIGKIGVNNNQIINYFSAILPLLIDILLLLVNTLHKENQPI